MPNSKNLDISEQLREALLDLERANRREHELRMETETLLAGLNVLIDYHDRTKMFEEMLELLRKLINFEDALILTCDGTSLNTVASTSEHLKKMKWCLTDSMKRISTGKPLAFFDISLVPEWQSQPEESRAGVCSAMHVLLHSNPRASLLICTHSKRGFFADKHLRLSTRFAPLASQAINNLEFILELEKINIQLQIETAERQKAQAQVVNASKMAALGEMASGVAHEINNPLTVIQARIEQLGIKTLAGKNTQEYTLKVVEVVSKTANRIYKIVQGLRAFAGGGNRELVEPVSVKTLIEDTLVLCRERFINNGVQFDVSMALASEEPLTVECRSTEISQVLVNLLNNAYDAVEFLAKKWIRLEVVDQSDAVELSIIDSGTGVPREIQEKIMQPFFTTKPTGKGTGLGLSISKGIVDAHNGRFYIDNTYVNTKFTIVLPKKQVSVVNNDTPAA